MTLNYKYDFVGEYIHNLDGSYEIDFNSNFKQKLNKDSAKMKMKTNMLESSIVAKRQMEKPS